MSETKRTVEGRECCYCHRNLPITYFPIKPGMKHARYKMCRDCHTLGHSCVTKPKPEPKRRKFANDEELKAAQREWQRLYREKNREKKREANRASYWRRKGMEAPEEKQKCGRKPILTTEERKARRREHTKKWVENNRENVRAAQRRYYQKKREKLIAKNIKYQQEHKDVRARAYAERKANAEKEAAETGRFYCTLCHRVMDAEAFIFDGRQYKLCNECRVKQKMRKTAKTREALHEPDKERKPKGPHGTNPRFEYNRQYWQDHKDMLKAKRCAALDESKAVVTDRFIVDMYEKGYSLGDISSRLQVTVGHIREVIERDGCRGQEVRLCCDCWLYPCFTGIENMSSNLALTCQKYHRKEDAS